MNTFIIIFLVVVLMGIMARKTTSKKKLTSNLNDDEIQRIGELKLNEVLVWSNRKLKDFSTDSELEINILPNKATLESLNEQLKLTPDLLKRSYLILILDRTNNTVLYRKLVIAYSISEELNSIKENKIYVTPLK